MADFLEALRQELRGIEIELAPLESRYEELRAKRDFLREMIEKAKTVYPQSNLAGQAQAQLRNEGVTITQLPPSRRGTFKKRLQGEALDKVILQGFKDYETLSIKDLATILFETGRYGTEEQAKRAADYIVYTKMREHLVEVEKGKYRLRQELATIAEVLKEKRR